jgi:hypothetical protein
MRRTHLLNEKHKTWRLRMKIRSVRGIAIVASAALVLGAFVAGPAEAAKKKKKKKKKPAACATYVPGEKGKGAPITVVTDAATADKPVEVTVATEPGLGFSSEEGEGNPDEEATSHAYTNVQVDSKAASAALTVILEFPQTWDYDLWLRDSSHAPVAYSAGFFNQTFGSDEAHSDFGSESVSGVPASDCGGFTVDVANAAGPGGDVTVKYYLGE